MTNTMSYLSLGPLGHKLWLHLSLFSSSCPQSCSLKKAHHKCRNMLLNNKCNQCDSASNLKTQMGEKSPRTNAVPVFYAPSSKQYRFFITLPPARRTTGVGRDCVYETRLSQGRRSNCQQPEKGLLLTVFV